MDSREAVGTAGIAGLALNNQGRIALGREMRFRARLVGG